MKKPKKIKLPCRFVAGECVYVEGGGYGTFVRQVERIEAGIYCYVRMPGRSKEDLFKLGDVLKTEPDGKPIPVARGTVRVILK